MSKQNLQQTIDFSWREFALCKNLITEDFFPYKINKNNADQIQGLIETCNQCSVKEECFYEAVTNEYHGIWAGTFYKERVIWVRFLKNNKEEITFESCADYLAANSNRRITSKTGTVDV